MECHFHKFIPSPFNNIFYYFKSECWKTLLFIITTNKLVLVAHQNLYNLIFLI